MPTLIACRHSPTYRKPGFKPPLQPPNGDTPTAKIHSFSLSGKFFWLKSASRKGNGRSPQPFCPTMGQKTQRAAQAIAPHCTRHRTALHQPSHRTAFPVPQQHLLPGKRQAQPQLPSTARLGQTSKHPLTTAGDPLQHGTLTRPIAPAASTSLPLHSPAVSQPYKIRCAE